jgi:hypothetical protein
MFIIKMGYLKLTLLFNKHRPHDHLIPGQFLSSLSSTEGSFDKSVGVENILLD